MADLKGDQRAGRRRRVNVELFWGGGCRYTFRLSLEDGQQFSVTGGTTGYWTPDVEKSARSLLSAETGVATNLFTFRHK